MLDRRHFIGGALGSAAAAGLASAPDADAQVLFSSDRLNQPGREAQLLLRRVGLWDVVETVWAAPGATPTTSRGLVAERVMVGTALQEFIRPPADSARRDVKRTDFLCYNRLDGRWDYLSFDTRVPVGLMPAYSVGRGDPERIEVVFLPFAIPPTVAGGGAMVRMRQTIIGASRDHDLKDQYFTLADGSATEWLAHRYAYERRA